MNDGDVDVYAVCTAYHCAYVSDILLQGFLYVTHNWFCFYSKLLGKKRVSYQPVFSSALK